jgi:hypothetical protein
LNSEFVTEVTSADSGEKRFLECCILVQNVPLPLPTSVARGRCISKTLHSFAIRCTGNFLLAPAGSVRTVGMRRGGQEQLGREQGGIADNIHMYTTSPGICQGALTAGAEETAKSRRRRSAAGVLAAVGGPLCGTQPPSEA